MRNRPESSNLSHFWAPYVPDEAMPWNVRRVVPLHRRAGFAANWDELRHDHFDTSNLKVNDLALMRRQNETLRSLSLAPFGRLLHAMLRDPALIIWLDASEFGRRVEENGSMGTDHGTAGTVFLAGPSVRPGLHGTYPSLTDLSNGDLKMMVDFRWIDATVLDRWLGFPIMDTLGETFEPMDLLSKQLELNKL